MIGHWIFFNHVINKDYWINLNEWLRTQIFFIPLKILLPSVILFFIIIIIITLRNWNAYHLSSICHTVSSRVQQELDLRQSLSRKTKQFPFSMYVHGEVNIIRYHLMRRNIYIGKWVFSSSSFLPRNEKIKGKWNENKYKKPNGSCF